MILQNKVISNLNYVLREVRRSDKALIWCHLAFALWEVLIPLSSAATLALIVRCASSPEEFEKLLVWFIAASTCTLLLNLLKRWTNEQRENRGYALRTRFQLKYLHHYMTISYSALEDPDGIDLAKRAVPGWSSSATEILVCGVSLVTVVIGIFSYGALLSVLDPIFIGVMILVTLGNFFLMQYLTRREYADKDDYTRVDRRIDYLCSACKDFGCSKDIRLFRLTDFFVRQIDRLIGTRLRIDLRRQKRVFGVQVLSALLTLIQSSVMYGYLILMIVRGEIDAAQFVYYFSLLTAFTGWIVQVIQQYSSLCTHSYNITDLRAFFDVSPAAGGDISPPKEAPQIELDHVSFSYDGKKTVLDDLSLSIAKGERIALVGLNGAGKTTLVKLLCGLYAPDNGQILFDSAPLERFDREKLYRLYSVVFQDICLLPVSIAENITLGEPVDRAKLDQVLQLSGLDRVLAGLLEGENTLLVRELHENAVELSGGQRQKLALARALYKDSPVVILDEPTAALDPITEDEIYRQYDEMTRGKTAVFISHRLASTQFCDKIYLLEDGKIAESGTHAELLAAEGRYAQLYRIQSKYYQQEEP